MQKSFWNFCCSSILLYTLWVILNTGLDFTYLTNSVKLQWWIILWTMFILIIPTIQITQYIPDRKFCTNFFEVSPSTTPSKISHTINTWESSCMDFITMARIIPFFSSIVGRISSWYCKSCAKLPFWLNLSIVILWSCGRQWHNPTKFFFSTATTVYGK